MLRPYTDKISDKATFFIGTEVEHTPAFGLKTLFVVGLQDANEIITLAEKYVVSHIYLGANMSFDPFNATYEHCLQWFAMINTLLDNGYLCTLDFDVRDSAVVFNSTIDLNNPKFIPQISVKIPYILRANKNATIKIDDSDFNFSNFGVWCKKLDSITVDKNFTNWKEYESDQLILKEE